MLDQFIYTIPGEHLDVTDKHVPYKQLSKHCQQQVLFACALDNKHELVRYILSQVPPNEIIEWLQISGAKGPLLNMAITNGFVNVLRVLLEYLEKAKITAPDQADEMIRNALFFASQSQREGIVKLIFGSIACNNRFANVMLNGKNPLHYSCMSGNASSVAAITKNYGEYCDLDGLTTDGLTPIHIAVLLGHTTIAHMLASAGASLTEMTPCGRTLETIISEQNSESDLMKMLNVYSERITAFSKKAAASKSFSSASASSHAIPILSAPVAPMVPSQLDPKSSSRFNFKSVISPATAFMTEKPNTNEPTTLVDLIKQKLGLKTLRAYLKSHTHNDIVQEILEITEGMTILERLLGKISSKYFTDILKPLSFSQRLSLVRESKFSQRLAKRIPRFWTNHREAMIGMLSNVPAATLEKLLPMNAATFSKRKITTPPSPTEYVEPLRFTTQLTAISGLGITNSIEDGPDESGPYNRSSVKLP
jgi:hypothetical protein